MKKKVQIKEDCQTTKTHFAKLDENERRLMVQKFKSLGGSRDCRQNVSMDQQLAHFISRPSKNYIKCFHKTFYSKGASLYSLLEKHLLVNNFSPCQNSHKASSARTDDGQRRNAFYFSHEVNMIDWSLHPLFQECHIEPRDRIWLYVCACQVLIFGLSYIILYMIT